MGVLTATLFYIDINPKKPERKEIERCIEEKNGALAFYDCSYYLFLHRQEDVPVNRFTFYHEIIQELRKVYTNDEKNWTLLDSIWNVAMSWVGQKTQIMSDQEFLTTTKEIYDITIEATARDISDNFKILKIREYDYLLIFENDLRKTTSEGHIKLGQFSGSAKNVEFDPLTDEEFESDINADDFRTLGTASRKK